VSKGVAAIALLEPLILYFVLFFSGISGPVPVEAGLPVDNIPFLPFRELNRTLSYSVPALALLWYLILEKKSLKPAENRLKPGVRDIYPFLLGFPCLVLTGLGISLLINRFSPFSLPPRIEAPSNALGWTVMAFSCLGTGYLEESYFRFYLLEKLEVVSPCRWIGIFLSVFFFSLCHIYEGPWGILNACLAGFILAVLYERFRSLHGIALAHGAYNAFVYVMAAFF
jgi:membrane protease YdiL (CAAX protease family)